MELYEAMSTTRAVRRLRPDPIDDEVLRRVLTAATYGPSGGNRQSWRMLVVKDASIKAQLQDVQPEEMTAALEDVFWALLNSKEFLFNH